MTTYTAHKKMETRALRASRRGSSRRPIRTARFVAKALGVAALLLAIPASAYDYMATSAAVTAVTINRENKSSSSSEARLQVEFDKTVCREPANSRWAGLDVRDGNRDAVKMTQKIALSALLSGKRVVVHTSSYTGDNNGVSCHIRRITLLD